MSKNKHIKWLYNELPKWEEQGWLTAQAKSEIKEHYGDASVEPAYNVALLLASVLGAILIGGGIILLFANNWDNFSRPVRTILSFAPLVLAQLVYGYVYLRERDNLGWVEGSSGFLMLMLAACIALISQTYHIQGDIESFLFIWMLLSIPLMYLMNASLPTLFYLVGITAWAINVGDGMSVGYWGFLLAALPHLYFNIYKSGRTVRANLLSWTLAITFSFAFWAVYDHNLWMEGAQLLFGMIFIALFYFVGEKMSDEQTKFFYKPFQVVAIFTAFILLMILGYDWPEGADFFLPNEDSESKAVPVSVYINLLVGLVALAAYVWIAISEWQKKKKINFFIVLLPVLIVVGGLLVKSDMESMAIVLANIYLFAFGIYYLRQGINEHKLSLVNLGMFFISALIVARFFDTDWSFVVKGIVFILLGVGFLLVNIFLSRKIKGM